MIKFLKKPYVLFLSILVGFLIAVFAKGIIPFLEPIATIYLNLLKMTVIPIVASALAINIKGLMQNHVKGLMVRWILVVFCCLLFSAFLGAGISALTRSWIAPNEAAIKQLTNRNDEEKEDVSFQTASYYEDTVEEEKQESFSLVDFLTATVPSNIFEALTSNNMIQIIFFFLMVGILLGSFPSEQTDALTKALQGIYELFCHLVGEILNFLPIGMCAMLAVQFQDTKIKELISVVGKFIALQWIVMLVIVICSFVIIQYKQRLSIKKHWKAIKRTLLVAMGTSSCIASISVALEDTVNEMKMDPEVTKAILPIGITTFQYGVIASGAIAAVYATTIYPVTMDLNTWIVLMVGAILFSFSIIGAPGVVAVTMLKIILTPLGIPSETIILIYLATIPFFDPAAVFASVYSNIAVSALISQGRKEHEVT